MTALPNSLPEALKSIKRWTAPLRFVSLLTSVANKRQLCIGLAARTEFFLELNDLGWRSRHTGLEQHTARLHSYYFVHGECGEVRLDSTNLVVLRMNSNYNAWLLPARDEKYCSRQNEDIEA